MKTQGEVYKLLHHVEERGNCRKVTELGRETKGK